MPDMNWYIVQDMVDQLTEIKNQLKILNDLMSDYIKMMG